MVLPTGQFWAADTLPAVLAQAAINATIDVASTHLLGTSSPGCVWVGTDARYELCTIISLVDEPKVSSIRCTNLDKFQTQGLSVSNGTTTAAVEAYLVPDAAVASLPAIASVDGSQSPTSCWATRPSTTPKSMPQQLMSSRTNRTRAALGGHAMARRRRA